MIPSDDRILTIISVAFLFVLTIWTVQPRLARHYDALTLIKCRFGEIDINRLPGGHAVIWWQDADYTVNVWLVVLPW